MTTAAKQQRAALKNPAVEPDAFIDRLRRQGLPGVAAFLQNEIKLIGAPWTCEPWGPTPLILPWWRSCPRFAMGLSSWPEQWPIVCCGRGPAPGREPAGHRAATLGAKIRRLPVGGQNGGTRNKKGPFGPCSITSNCLFYLARPERFELPTPWFVARYSIQLSYGR